MECTHLDQIKDVQPSANGCQTCLEIGSTWVHLRICRTCGYVGCCDSSQHRHSTAHFHTSGHPIVQSIEPGEDWLYCHLDRVFLELA